LAQVCWLPSVFHVSRRLCRSQKVPIADWLPRAEMDGSSFSI